MNNNAYRVWCFAAAGSWFATAGLELFGRDPSMLMPALITAVVMWKLGMRS